jgi:hypothetical protein
VSLRIHEKLANVVSASFLGDSQPQTLHRVDGLSLRAKTPLAQKAPLRLRTMGLKSLPSGMKTGIGVGIVGGDYFGYPGCLGNFVCLQETTLESRTRESPPRDDKIGRVG